MPLENVRCIYLEGSGCYGRNGHEDAAADAALLAKAVGRAGARAMVARRRARLGPEGSADADRPARGARRVGQRDGLGIGVLHSAADGGRVQGAAGRGDARRHAARRRTSRRATSSRTRTSPTSSPTSRRSATGSRRRRSGRPGSARRAGCRTPTPTSASWTSWRRRRASTRSSSASNISIRPTSAASKCSNRRRRAREVGEAALAAAERRAATSSRAAACPTCKYELVRTYVGAVAEVEVNRATGEIRVPKFYLAHDCGQIINPDGLQEPARRQRHPDGEPDADRGAEVRPLARSRASTGRAIRSSPSRRCRRSSST